MPDHAARADQTDVRKTAVLVVIVLVLFACFFFAFPAGNGLHVSSLEDEGGALTVDQVMAAPAARWQDHGGHTFNAGYTGSAHWVRARLPAWADGGRLLVINFPLLEEIQLFRRQAGGAVTGPLLLGAALPFGQRMGSSTSYVVPLDLADSEATVFVRVRTRSSMQVPLELWTRDAFENHERGVTLFHGAYLGVVVAMLLYNILLYALIRERAYVWYIGWVVFMALLVITINGMAFQWLWPKLPWLSFAVVPVALSLAIACASRFFIRFLNERGASVRLFQFIVLGCLAVAVASLGLPFQVSVIAAIAMAMLMVGCAVCIAAWRARQGLAAASYFLMAFSFVIAGGVALALNKFGLVPRTFATEYAAELGSAIEVVVLSFAMIVRFNSQRRQREEAQQLLLQTEQQRTVELEARVMERTAELESANDQLLALSRVDALTGLYNRRFLDERLHEELRRANRLRSGLAVLLIDVDHFKQLNDSHGHQVGDLCLQALARQMSASVRAGDVVARFGGEEFVVLVPDINAAGALTLAEKLRQHLASTRIQAAGVALQVTVSIGVCWRQSEGQLSAAPLVAAADKALYQAKQAGRNRVETA